MDNENNNVSTQTSSGKGGGMIWVIIIILIIAGIGAYFAFGKNKSAGTPSATASSTSVATVNGVDIAQSVYDTQLASAISSYKAQGVDVASTTILSQIKTQVLDGLINSEVLNQAITASGVVALTVDVDKQIEAAKTQAGGADKFQAELVKNNLTEAQLRENVSKQLAIQTYLLKNVDVNSITVSDAEISQFYDQYSKAQKAAGQTVPALKTLSAQIKQQLVSNKQQVMVNNFVAGLRAKANVVINAK